jgi:hypothetical protein
MKRGVHCSHGTFSRSPFRFLSKQEVPPASRPGSWILAESTRFWYGDALIARFRDVTELLLAHKADVNAKDNDGATPLDWAAGAKHIRIAAGQACPSQCQEQ